MEDYGSRIMKKIVYVSNANIPSNSASSIHVMKMCEAFKKNGMDITLIIPNHYSKKKHKDTDIFTFYGVKEKFPVKRIKFIRKNVKGIREIIYTICAVFYAVLKRPDAIMTRKIMAARVASMIGFPYILELHTSTEPRRYSLEKTLQSKHMKKLIVISKSLKEHMMGKYHIDGNRIEVLADAVNLSNFETLDTTLQIGSGPLKIAYMGSLFPGKGIETIIRLAAIDMKNQYDLYGERGPLDGWKKLAKEIDSKVNFKGQIANAKVPETLVQYDVLLMPYSNKVEVYGEELTGWMSPLKMFEYMASGRIIISSDLPVIREVLIDRRNAYLVEPDNPEAWYMVIEEIEKNRENATHIAYCAKSDVKRYTWEERAARIQKIVDE